MQAAYGKLMATTKEQELSSTTVPFAIELRKWFDVFDRESEEMQEASLSYVAENEFPVVEWKIAMGFLILDSNSPYYFSQSDGQENSVANITSRMNGADFAVAKALALAKNAALAFILNAPKMSSSSNKRGS